MKNSQREKSDHHKGATIRPTANFIAAVGARSQLNNVFKMLRENDCQPRIVYPSKLSCKSEGERNIFSENKS